MTPHAAAAELVAEYGIPVFPCRPDKKPASAHGFKDATTDLEAVDRWFTQENLLVGVPTGAASRLLVIDIDPAGAGWYTEHAASLACARVHQTRRGWHLLYRMPAETIACSAGQVAPGVDVRADGGYIVWWPAAGLPASGDLADVAPPPDWLLDLVRKPARRAQAQPAAGGVSEGGRNSFLAAQAGRLRRAGLSGPALRAALEGINQAQCDPPLPDREVARIAQSAEGWEGGDAEPAPIAFADISVPSLADVNEAHVPPRTWFWRDILPAGAFLIVGRAKVGKSWLLLQLLLAAARGQSFLGYDNTEARHD